jgi:hypothetical protein
MMSPPVLMVRATISVLAPLALRNAREPTSIFEPGVATMMLLKRTVEFSPTQRADG